MPFDTPIAQWDWVSWMMVALAFAICTIYIVAVFRAGKLPPTSAADDADAWHANK
jgi:hypothetical protein